MEHFDYSSVYRDKVEADLDKVSTFRIIKSWVRGGKLLDIACGTGYLLDYLGGGVGVDIDPGLIRECKERYPANRFIVSDCYNIPLEDGQFDTVVMCMIIEHLVEPGVALTEARRLLKPGGNLVVVVPNRRDPIYRFLVAKDPTHVREYSVEEIKGLAGDFFEVNEVRFGSASTKIPAWTTNFLRCDILVNCIKRNA